MMHSPARAAVGGGWLFFGPGPSTQAMHNDSEYQKESNLSSL